MSRPGSPGLPAAPDILFDGRYIQDRYHGIGRYAYHLVTELAGLLPYRRIELLRDPALPDSRFDWSALAATPNVSVREVAAPPFSLKEQPAVSRALLARRGALYHTPYFALPWLLAPGARSLVTVHDCIFERDARYMPRRWAGAYYRLLMTASLTRSRGVLVPSRATASDLRRFYRVPAGKITVTPEAAGAEFRPVTDHSLLDDVRQRHRLPDTFVLSVGARRPHKNFPTLVRAIARTQDTHLVFAGEADERFPDDTAAAARELGDRVRFLGKVPEADLPVLYNLASVFACPSIIEGFGLPVLEAMACGTPVVCSDIPVFREVAADAALLVPPTDPAAWAAAIERLVRDPQLRASCGRQGLHRAARFTWRRTAEALLPRYAKLIGS